jgi:hypothetical protein
MNTKLRAVLYVIFSAASKLIFFVAYLMSIFVAYHVKGIFWACVMAIPFFGQVIWFGMMWGSRGFFNPFSYLIIGGLVFYLFAYLMIMDSEEQEAV